MSNIFQINCYIIISFTIALTVQICFLIKKTSLKKKIRQYSNRKYRKSRTVE